VIDPALTIPGWSFLCAGVGAYIGSYLKKKGENLATHEDLNLLVEQMEATNPCNRLTKTSLKSSWLSTPRLNICPNNSSQPHLGNQITLLNHSD
jgi:hypothetical protein